MLEAQKLNKFLWVEAVANVVYTLNRCSMKALRSITPEETWGGRRPYIAHIPMFGSIVYGMVPDKKNGKLYTKEIKYVFLEYCEGIKAYRLMSLETQKIIKNRDVMIMENRGSIENLIWRCLQVREMKALQ